MDAVYTPYERRSNGVRAAAAICLCYTLLFFLVGVWLHLKSRSFRWDGIVAGIATLLALGHFVTQFVALGYGQGRTVEYLSTSSDLASLNSTSRAGVILFFLALYASKGAGVAFLYQFALLRRHKITILVLCGVFLLWGIISVLVLNVSCGLTGMLYWHIVRHSQQCQNQYTRWQVTSALDIASEVMILLTPIDLIWSLQMRPRVKIGVLFRFWIRLPVAGIAVGRFIYVRKLLFSRDVGIASNMPVIFEAIELMASLSATVMINLRPITKEMNTNFGQIGGAVTAHGLTNQYASSGGGLRSGTRATAYAAGSKIASRMGLSSGGRSAVMESATRSGNREKDAIGLVDMEHSRVWNPHRGHKATVETSESVKGLTRDVITHTIDFQVEYEDTSEAGRSSRSV